LTRASNATITQARIHELEATLHKQQTEIDLSSKTTFEKLFSMENQFKRLAHLDTKITDMGSQLHQVNIQQETQSTLIQSIKSDTHVHIKKMGASLVNSFTSQNKMADSMRTMQERIDKITELMQILTNRLDNDQSTTTGKAPHRKDTEPDSPNQHDAPLNTQSDYLTTTQTCTSKSSSSGSFNDLCYNSPQKKKTRSPKDRTEATYTTDMHLCQSDDDSTSTSDDNTTITTTTSNATERKTLNKRLFLRRNLKPASLQSLTKSFTKEGSKRK
jgi:uncharacterized coiled-coil protein SlyX